jgi:hypothetical protein
MSIVAPATSHQSKLGAGYRAKSIYVRRPPLVYFFPFQRYASFLINDPSKWPSVITDDPGWQGDDAIMFETLGIKAIQILISFISVIR